MSPDFSDENTLVYGHNMKNGSMFGQLKNYQEKEFYGKNPGFFIDTPGGQLVLYHFFLLSGGSGASGGILHNVLCFGGGIW